MNPFKRATPRELMADESGQMAIFIALIFQVLFIFFAMVVNVGLIVHDKINLQNSVDLAAYYAAGQQALALNEIAHINYQMRQDYKLLAWRMRALGMMGRLTHPLFGQNYTSYQTDEELNQDFTNLPSICIAHRDWLETRSTSLDQNLCRNAPAQNFIPQIPSVQVIFPLPDNFRIQRLVDRFRQSFSGNCRSAGPANWAFAANINLAFRYANIVRKNSIKRIALNLNQPIRAGGFKDREGRDVFEGMRKTFEKNLTRSNASSSDLSLQAMNGLSIEACAQVENGYPLWLREILITPMVMYTNTREAGGCVSEPTLIEVQPTYGYQNYDPTNDLQRFAQAPFDGIDPKHPSRGFEKNPWCLAYVGVKAVTNPRKPFAPFGSPIRLEARAFAMPFGGRIGPWDRAGWAPQGTLSSGAPVDPLAVPRRNPNAFINRTADDPTFYPNYSRYPGDRLGLRSGAALSATWPSLKAPIQAGGSVQLAHYNHLPDLNNNGDPLAFDPDNPEGSGLRSAEIAAITPDLFDATYYAVEPNFFKSYFRYTIQRGRTTPPSFSDLGTNLSVPVLSSRSVTNQINDTLGEPRKVFYPQTFWLIAEPDHLLTSWVSQNPSNFVDFPQAFGKCDTPVDQDKPGTVGDCIIGGRTGYSVKLVNKAYLKWDGHKLGGAEGAADKIKNPPEDDF